jgi:hypothetical protein
MADTTDEALCVTYVDADHGSATQFQVFRAGRLDQWRRGLPDAVEDLRLRQPADILTAMLLRSGDPASLLEATEVVDPGSGQVWLPPPLDEVRLPWAEELPVIPTVGSFGVQQTLVGTPFGDLDLHARIDRGRLVDVALGMLPSADLLVVRGYDQALQERAGEIDLMDSLEGGRVEGDFQLMTVFIGLYESDECVAARQALTHPWCAPLTRLGAWLSSPEWDGMAQRLGLLAAQGADLVEYGTA